MGASAIRAFRPTNGVSPVSTRACAPAATARRTRPIVMSRSCIRYTWNHQAPPAAATASPTCSIGQVLRVDSTNSAPARAAAVAAATSPSGWASRWNAVGATASGVRTRSSSGPPSTTLVSTADTSRSTRGRNCIRRHAFWLARSVASCPAPPA